MKLDDFQTGQPFGKQFAVDDESPVEGPARNWDEHATTRLPVLRRIGWLTRLRWWFNNRRTVHVVVSEPSQDAMQARRVLLMPAAPSPFPAKPPATPEHLRSVPFSVASAAESEKLERVTNAVMFSLTQHIAVITGKRATPAEIETLRSSLKGALNQAREIGACHANDGRRALDRRNTEASTRPTDPGPRSARRTLKRQTTEKLDVEELNRMILAAVPPPSGSFDKK